MTPLRRIAQFVVARSHLDSSGDRPAGAAGRSGQGVQPQPPEVRPPQRAAEGSGGAVHRGAAPAEQAPQGAVRWMGGAAPPAREARQPASDLREAQAGPAGHGAGASSPGAPAQAGGERSEPAAQPPRQVAALRAAGPRGRRSRPLEAAGREGRLSRTGGASSPATPGESATADVPQARPGGWPDRHASALAGKTSTSLLP